MIISIIQLIIISASVGIVFYIAVKKITTEKEAKKAEELFWINESNANFARKKNLDTLDYIQIPYDSFPIGICDDKSLIDIENTLLSLKDKRILNLTGKTSTELKLEYGAANLPVMDEIDNNFVLMVKALQDYADTLYSLGYQTASKTVLEFSIESGSDIKATYMLLAKQYADANETDKITYLIDKAKSLDSLMKNSIIGSLEEMI